MSGLRIIAESCITDVISLLGAVAIGLARSLPVVEDSVSSDGSCCI